jgi:hypothetical protein
MTLVIRHAFFVRERLPPAFCNAVFTDESAARRDILTASLNNRASSM